MADAQLIVSIRRLMTDVRELKTALRQKYSGPKRQVTSPGLRRKASELGEAWLADLSQRPAVERAVSADYIANLNVHFQRLLTFAEQATIRGRYDAEIRAILQNHVQELVVPLMQQAERTEPAQPVDSPSPAPRKKVPQAADEFRPTAFVGHSFDSSDMPVVQTLTSTLQALGITVVTGEKPKAETISGKVKGRIEAQYLFVGIFMRRDKLVGKDAWNTSPWVIDEKAYAYGQNKKLILLKEAGVESIGGIQGDYEYIEFAREKLEDAVLRLIETFVISVNGLS